MYYEEYKLNYHYTTDRLIVKEWHSFGSKELHQPNLENIVEEMLVPEVTKRFPIMWRGDYDKKRAKFWIQERDSESKTLLAVEKETKKALGYINFFNYITIQLLGNPKQSPIIKQKTTGALIYFPDEIKEKSISNFDIVSVSNLYYGILTNGLIPFNYEKYTSFLSDLYELRKKYKETLKDQYNEKLMSKSILVKCYMNSVYGMINNPSSVLTSKMDNPREFIVEQSKKIMLSVVSFFINKSYPLYYIDTDEMFVPHISETLFEELQSYFIKNCSQFTNLNISKPFISDNQKKLNGYMVAKKRMMYGCGEKTKMVGLYKADDNVVLIQNKKFFGRNYKEIFPEYSIW